ncbi:MAG: hypothetical protein HOP29_09425 [Phycisphaerales bacterium]|nr:hypothetical protein [Phycisphaerales bacterium]
MLCQKCRKSPATVHLLDIVPPDGEKIERHFCERCSAEEGLATPKQETISSMLEGFIKQSAGITAGADLSCPDCGMTFREFRSTGLLGCPNDYKAFEKHLAPLIERAHRGATHHVGKGPARLDEGAPGVHTQLAKLRRQLKEAIKLEDYEEAARLRDRIKTCESA